ncbi:hypothetical protein BV20DRAFT_355458 [Pilatotrama ljubarskyi]|nr:hypothetical protein BV20DRAFT_355458 [Pilatotrama ljubarskyi]
MKTSVYGGANVCLVLCRFVVGDGACVEQVRGAHARRIPAGVSTEAGPASEVPCTTAPAPPCLSSSSSSSSGPQVDVAPPKIQSLFDRLSLADEQA